MTEKGDFLLVDVSVMAPLPYTVTTPLPDMVVVVVVVKVGGYGGRREKAREKRTDGIFGEEKNVWRVSAM